MLEASIITSNGFVGQSTDNVAIFTFTPVIQISTESGRIEIETPVWASQYTRKKIVENSYPMSEEACTSDQFTSLTQTVSDAIITIDYEGYNGEQYDIVTLNCPGWSNPIVPDIIDGYQIRVYDLNLDLTNEITNFIHDASHLEATLIGGASHLLGNSYNSELTDLTLILRSEVPISSTDGCYVQYNFPAEFGLSQFDINKIEAYGMFVDSNGNRTTSAFSHNIDDPTEEKKWIAVEGCRFDPVEKTTEQLKDFSQNLFVVKFFNIMNPWIVADTSEFEIEIFYKWEDD